MCAGAWSSEMETLAAALWRGGWTARDVAERVGALAGRRVTRNAVLGKLHRLRLLAPLAKRRNGKRCASSAVRKQKRCKPRATVSKPQGIDDLVVSGTVSLLEARRDQCRAVINGGEWGRALFCGAPVERRSYCAAHAAVFYVARRRKA